MIRKLSLTAAAAVLAASPVLADTYAIDKAHSEASFQIRHMMSKVRGHFNDYAGTINVDPAKPESASVEFAVKAASIDTSNEGRDTDLRSPNFFDVEKFPEMTFQSTAVERTGETTLKVTGTVTLRGITRPMLLAVSVTDRKPDAPAGARYARFRAEGSIKRSEFGMTKFVEVVGDTVDITIRAEAWR